MQQQARIRPLHWCNTARCSSDSLQPWAQRSEPCTWHYWYLEVSPGGTYFKEIIWKTHWARFLLLSRHSSASAAAEASGPAAPDGMFALWTEASGASLRGTAACALLRNTATVCGQNYPFLNFIYTLLNSFTNQALCFMPGVVPHASFSLHKPMGLALICFPSIPGFENASTTERKRGWSEKKEVRAQSKFPPVNLIRCRYEGWLSCAVLTPSPQVLGLMGDCFSPSDCVNEEAVDSHGTGKTYVLHYLDSLYCFSLLLLAGNTQPWAVPIFKMHFFLPRIIAKWRFKYTITFMEDY